MLELRQVAQRQLERLDELLLAVAAEGPRQVDRPRRVVEALGRLQPADLVEEPAATGVHEHRVALHLEQPKRVADLGIVEVGVPVAAEEKADSLRVAVEDHVDVGVPRLPGIGEALAPPGAEDVVKLVLQLVERPAERPAPLLVPVAPGLAAAVRVPSLNPVAQLQAVFSWISTSHWGGCSSRNSP